MDASIPFSLFSTVTGFVSYSGGGEDVDFALRAADASNGGKLIKVPEACVVHPFWPGRVFELMSHFFNWAVGDGGLLKRHPEHCHWSFPNLPEMLLLLSPLLLWMLIHTGPWNIAMVLLCFLIADFLVDFFNRDDNQQYEYQQWCHIVQVNGDPTSSLERHKIFYFAGHILANWYVVVLEYGRLWGHIRRLELLEGLCQ